MLSRRNLTDALLAAVGTTTDLPVLDAQPPSNTNFGWSGQPGEAGSTFTPYTILTPQQSSNATGPLADTHSDWRLSYSLTSFGTSREQCEWIADLARSSLYGLQRDTFDGIDSDYTILQVRTDTIGGVIRSDVTNPPMFGQTDIYSVWVAKGT